MSNNKVVKFNNNAPVRTPWPFPEVEALTPFSSIFNDFFNESFPSLDVGFFEKNSYPKVDVIDENEQTIIEAEIPGLAKEQVSIEVENDVLRIKGDKKEEVTSGGTPKKYLHRELKRSSFCRSFTLGDNYNKDKIDAKFENGILKIYLPKHIPEPKKEEVKKIDIK